MTTRYDGKFTVSCEIACVVAWSADGGLTFNRMIAVEDEDNEGTYVFTLPEGARAEGAIIAVALKGDLTLDGFVDSTDSKQAQRYDVGSRTLTSLQFLAADVNVDGEVDSTDAKQIQIVEVGKKKFPWNKEEE